jgi:hypothetical protein
MRHHPTTDKRSPSPIALTIEERINAMWARELTLSQLCEWSSRWASRVPRLGREFARIVMRISERDEVDDEQRNNVIRLLERSEQRATA